MSRAPIVVVLGHVDHGKTTLLDAIRATDVASREYGGITQKIGAYQVNNITFIDTPGHEAFAKMRSRGASVADIAILVVAANDSVMPQTVESIKIVQEANVPFIVAINKVDLPEANVDKVIQDLLRHNVLVEGYGGQVPYVKISAKKKEGIKELLELIQLLAEVNGVSGDPNAPLEATVIESNLDKNRGPVATLIIRNGTLKVGQELTLGQATGKIRALIDYQGKQIKEAGPGTPVEVLGLSKPPIQGEALHQPSGSSILNLILKADTEGSLEALIAKLPENINLLQASNGDISEADILLAKSTKAIILGFNIKVSSSAENLARSERVLARTYKIIYELLDELNDAAAGLLHPEPAEEILGTGQIIAEFPYENVRVAGVRVTDGRMARGDLVKINDRQSKIKGLRIGREEINKVEKGKECGVLLDPQVDFKLEDAIICYRI